MGMGDVNAISTMFGDSEKFIIIDANGGTLNSGDTVSLQVTSGRYVSNGGGTTLSVFAPYASTNELYVIEKKDAAGTQIVSGDTIAFRAQSNAK